MAIYVAEFALGLSDIFVALQGKSNLHPKTERLKKRGGGGGGAEEEVGQEAGEVIAARS